MIDLNITWFLLVGVLIIGYAILDGFDLGVGVIQLFTKDKEEKRINKNAIGPVWDGNEVWLLTAGGALFAAFPIVYATVFSGFYLAFILLLVALIFRAVSFEFGKYVETEKAKGYWDIAFSLGSLVPALLYGVAFGNILRGIPLDQKGNFLGSFIGLLNPYSLLIGVLSLAMLTMHGAAYLTLKTEGKQKERMIDLTGKMWIAFVSLYLLATLASFFVAPFLFENVFKNPLFWVLLIVLFVSIILIPVTVRLKKNGLAFLFSSITIGVMIGLAALSLFPRLVPSSIDLSYSLTIYNASSTPRTLFTMLIIALTGMPLVIGYTIFVYRVFKGKVVINKESY
jgi:cytochrome bd ubiquinol oxidase subunit II